VTPGQEQKGVSTSTLELPPIEGLAMADGLARAGGDSKVYLKALQHFSEEQGGTPERIRDALLRGDLTAADQMARRLKIAAGEIGATAVQSSAAAVAGAVLEQPDPGEMEALWAALDKAVRDLVSELRPLLKPKEGKSAKDHRQVTAAPVNPAELRKAVSEIVPLLADRDPGARDCLKANRAIFRSAFTPEAYSEFERAVKVNDFDGARDQLKKAVRKHGLSI
jgi:HPt (histidine-containing phosphotransfer) domain-containing protein